MGLILQQYLVTSSQEIDMVHFRLFWNGKNCCFLSHKLINLPRGINLPEISEPFEELSTDQIPDSRADDCHRIEYS